jgi:probable DNA metabolism protein
MYALKGGKTDMIYLFDGTKEGFLTAFCTAFCDKRALLTSTQAQLRIGEDCIRVPTNIATAQKAEARLTSFDPDFAYDLDILLRSGVPGNEQIAFRYFRVLAEHKTPVNKRLANPDVFAAVECIKKVGHEIHKLHGFVRFMETANEVLYAPITPDNDVCDLLAPHFKARFPFLPFVIHDVKRQKAAVYNGKILLVVPLSKAEVILSANETEWQSLWKRYYQATTVAARTSAEREKQMRGNMPVRYWKFLTERQG